MPQGWPRLVTRVVRLTVKRWSRPVPAPAPGLAVQLPRTNQPLMALQQVRELLAMALGWASVEQGAKTD